jgi:hypothetical protein
MSATETRAEDRLEIARTTLEIERLKLYWDIVNGSMPMASIHKVVGRREVRGLDPDLDGSYNLMLTAVCNALRAAAMVDTMHGNARLKAGRVMEVVDGDQG